jgi:hypothetical protein
LPRWKRAQNAPKRQPRKEGTKVTFDPNQQISDEEQEETKRSMKAAAFIVLLTAVFCLMPLIAGVGGVIDIFLHKPRRQRIKATR